MAPTFRFSHRPNRAAEIAWREWGAAALAEAEATNRPVLLNLCASWCDASHEMDETTFSDPAVIEFVNARVIPIRVDADRNPHVQDRYIAGGWPTNAFLTSTGEVLWADTYTSAGKLLEVALGVTTAWSERREEFQMEIERRRMALEASRSRHADGGLVRRDASNDIVSATRDTFDARNGGFGNAPKFPPGEAIELLYTISTDHDADAITMADRTLDGMLAGDLLDRGDGGFFRYATSADWTAPRFEKLLEINAVQLEAFALGASVRARPDWEEIARGIVGWVDSTLGLQDGLWAGSQSADEEYFALAREQRAGRVAPPVDTTVFTAWNAMWIAALTSAGARLGEQAWIDRAEVALTTLITTMSSSNGLFYHYRDENGDRDIDFLLMDAVEVARAAMLLYQATGRTGWLDTSRSLAQVIEKSFWAEDGGFWDRTKTHEDVGALRYRDRPFDLNARTARLLLDIAFATGNRGFRALAERTLALLSPQASRFGVAGATFALAVEEFFSPPLYVVLVGAISETARLRASALRLPHAARRVWTLTAGGRVGTQTIPAEPAPAAYACGRHGSTRALIDESAIAAAITPLV